MVKACKVGGVKRGVRFQLRYHPGYVEASRLVREGGLDVVVLAQVLLGSGGRGQVKR